MLGIGRMCCCQSCQLGKRRPSWSILANFAAISIHLTLFSVLVVGGIFDDLLQGCRVRAAILLLSLGFVSAIGYTRFQTHSGCAGPVLSCTVAAVAWVRFSDP